MNRTFLLPLKPLHDAPFMELAKTLQPYQRLSLLILLHADRALLRRSVFAQTVFLGCREGEETEGRGRRLRPGTAAALARRCRAVSGVCLDAFADVRFPCFFIPVFAPWWEAVVADGTDIAFVDASARSWTLAFSISISVHSRKPRPWGRETRSFGYPWRDGS